MYFQILIIFFWILSIILAVSPRKKNDFHVGGWFVFVQRCWGDDATHIKLGSRSFNSWKKLTGLILFLRLQLGLSLDLALEKSAKMGILLFKSGSYLRASLFLGFAYIFLEKMNVPSLILLKIKNCLYVLLKMLKMKNDDHHYSALMKKWPLISKGITECPGEFWSFKFLILSKTWEPCYC